MAWSIRSPNMSSIKHLWDVVEMSIYVQNGAPTNTSEFWTAIEAVCSTSLQRSCLISTLNQAIESLSQY